MVEILVEELKVVNRKHSGLEKGRHTSFAGLAISLKGTGAAMMTKEMDGGLKYYVCKVKAMRWDAEGIEVGHGASKDCPQVTCDSRLFSFTAPCLS